MTPNPKDDPLGWLRATSDQPWLSTAEAAKQLGITPGRLCRLRRLGRTPPAASMRVSRNVILWSLAEPWPRTWGQIQLGGYPKTATGPASIPEAECAKPDPRRQTVQPASPGPFLVHTRGGPR